MRGNREEAAFPCGNSLAARGARARSAVLFENPQSPPVPFVPLTAHTSSVVPHCPAKPFSCALPGPERGLRGRPGVPGGSLGFCLLLNSAALSVFLIALDLGLMTATPETAPPLPSTQHGAVLLRLHTRSARLPGPGTQETLAPQASNSPTDRSLSSPRREGMCGSPVLRWDQWTPHGASYRSWMLHSGPNAMDLWPGRAYQKHVRSSVSYAASSFLSTCPDLVHSLRTGTA